MLRLFTIGIAAAVIAIAPSKARAEMGRARVAGIYVSGGGGYTLDRGSAVTGHGVDSTAISANDSFLAPDSGGHAEATLGYAGRSALLPLLPFTVSIRPRPGWRLPDQAA